MVTGHVNAFLEAKKMMIDSLKDFQLSPKEQKEECIREILYYSNELVEKKWWQDKNRTKGHLKYYLKELKKLNKK